MIQITSSGVAVRLPEVKAHSIKLLYHISLMLVHFRLHKYFLIQMKVTRFL